MNIEGVDESKRQFLTSALTVVGAVGTGYLAVPFLAQMQPSVKAMAAGAP
ncbi:MAG: ubiquinol-cytochrome c reductase iron-sulfur subunit, partial [Methyloglobulus sp.]|nr:ubiquinol-cytochrome c reductase iron-sulfur subunit [Methyloglobulus sp.]